MLAQQVIIAFQHFWWLVVFLSLTPDYADIGSLLYCIMDKEWVT
jgi:hypothetical protein